MNLIMSLKNRHRRLTAIGLAIAALHLPAAALDYTWGGSSGAWSDSARWNLLGVPGANDGALINSGTAFVTSPTSVGILRLTGSGAQAGPADLSVGSLVFDSGGMGNGSSGRTIVNGTARFEGSLTQRVNAQHELVLNGASVWTVGNGAIGGTGWGGVVVNTAGATFRDEGTAAANFYKSLRDQQGSYTGGVFLNQGTYVRSGLGRTLLYGFNNSGVLQVDSGVAELRDSFSSSGLITVATAGTLSLNGWGGVALDANITGRIDNANGGVLAFQRGNNSFSAAARFDGTVRIFEGLIINAGTQTLTSLLMDGGGQLTGSGSVTTQSLDFRAGTLGGASTLGAAVVGGTTVTGASVFDGNRTQRVAGSHTLTLQGDSRWTAGNGGLGSTGFGGVVVNTAGATFRDEGTSAANFYKALRDQQGSYTGGTFVNQGTYVRSGLGTTRLYGFNNTGVLQVNEGTAEVREGFSNTGIVRLAAGAVLSTGVRVFATAGTIEGNGVVRTFSPNDVLANSGLLSPGSAQTVGTLTVDGSLSLAPTSMLRIDFDASGAADRLAITGLATLGGTLAVWAAPGQVFELGQSFVFLTVGQGSNMLSFSGLTWLGEGANPFTVRYAPQSVSLLVTTAVPEPATWAFMLAGLAGLLASARRRAVTA